MLGISGAQGSGKSTLAAQLAAHLGKQGIAVLVLSIDDLYLTRAERDHLAETVHPLLRTRGVPGTHDVELALSIVACLDRGEACGIPRFDKADDDRAGVASHAPAGIEVLILEGWCVGARPQPAGALKRPVNALEREEDPDGRWRSYVNAALAGRYQRLFDRIDMLALLAAPDFEVVTGWRIQQEQGLGEGSAVMTPGQVARFVQYYERLTRHILHEMPGRADLVARLGRDRAVLDMSLR